MKLIVGIATLFVALAFIMLAVATVGIVAYFVLIPHAQHYMATPTPTVEPAPAALSMTEQIFQQQKMPEHRISGKVFDDNQHAVLITSSNGESFWGYCGACGDYDMTIRTDAREFTFSVYQMPEMSRVYGSNWIAFSPSGSNAYNVDCSNM